MTTIEVPPVEGFWGPATPDGLEFSDWNQRKSWLGQNLSESQQRFAACALARRVLHIFESRHPEEKRPRIAIETSKRFALGLATSKELSKSRSDAFAAAAASSTAAAATAADAVYAAAVAAAYAADAAAVAAAYAAATAADAVYAAAVAAAYAADAAAGAAGAAAAYAAADAIAADATAADAAYAAADAAAYDAHADTERLDQARILTLFLPCDSVISESSKGLASSWIHQYLEHGIDAKGIREILADSLADDGVPEERCEYVRHIEQWCLGMWPMVIENFTRS